MYRFHKALSRFHLESMCNRESCSGGNRPFHTPYHMHSPERAIIKIGRNGLYLASFNDITTRYVILGLIIKYVWDGAIENGSWVEGFATTKYKALIYDILLHLCVLLVSWLWREPWTLASDQTRWIAFFLSSLVIAGWVMANLVMVSCTRYCVNISETVPGDHQRERLSPQVCSEICVPDVKNLYALLWCFAFWWGVGNISWWERKAVYVSWRVCYYYCTSLLLLHNVNEWI